MIRSSLSLSLSLSVMGMHWEIIKISPCAHAQWLRRIRLASSWVISHVIAVCVWVTRSSSFLFPDDLHMWVELMHRSLVESRLLDCTIPSTLITFSPDTWLMWFVWLPVWLLRTWTWLTLGRTRWVLVSHYYDFCSKSGDSCASDS